MHQVYEFLRRLDDDPIQMTHAEIREESGVGLNESAVGAILKILDGAGALEKFALARTWRSSGSTSNPRTTSTAWPTGSAPRPTSAEPS